MLDKDWHSVHAGFEAWLSPANFDAMGKQKAKLRVAERMLSSARFIEEIQECRSIRRRSGGWRGWPG
jgi:hypothetical protein